MYNGRDGVVTDDNGLIYMRARYYSPELRRFVNADILIGNIVDSTSLNRYSYVNGNPVSFIDPFGLSKERGGLSDSEYKSFQKIMKELMVFSSKQNLAEYKIDTPYAVYYRQMTTTHGSGDIDIDKFLEGEFELFESHDLSMGTLKRTTGNKLLFGVEYSVDIDEYTTVAASANFNADGTVSAEYKITAKYEDGFSFSLTTGMETKRNDGKNISTPETVIVEKKKSSLADDIKNGIETIGAYGKAIGEGFVDIMETKPVLGALLVVILLAIPGPQPI